MLWNVASALTRALLCALLLAGGAAAQDAGPAPASPQLVARDYFDGSGGEPRPQALRVARLEIEAFLVGGTAQTTVTAQFSNPTSRPLEGEFTLDLPPGSVVTGYALDINGRLVDGVITPRRQALRAYEARVRRGIDPGVAEVTRANVFRTRVFPIFPGAGRTVRLSFATPLDAEAPFLLPLATSEAVGELVVRVRAEAAGTPIPEAPGGLRLQRVQAEGGPGWEGRARNVRLSGALRVGPVSPAAPATVSRHAAGDFFLDLADTAPNAGTAAAPGRRLRLYWDRSRSRRDDDLEGELRLLGRYLAAVRPTAVDLVTFSEGGPETRSFRQPAPGELEAALRPLEYAGATSLAGVFTAPLPLADACLLFSDGTVSLDAYRAEALPCPLMAVSSAPDADRALLSALASASGGEHIDLRAVPADAALARLSAQGARVTTVVDDGGADLQPAILPAGPGRFRVVARAPDDGGAVTVRFADGSRRSYPGSSVGARRHDAPGALWASARLATLNATDRPDTAALLRTARRFGVPASGLAYVVLETPSDYAQAEIEPPPSLGADARNTYRQIASGLAQQKQRERAGRLQRVLDAWEEHKLWWRDPAAVRRRAERVEEITLTGRRGGRGNAPVPPPPAPMPAPPPPPPPPPVQARTASPAPDSATTPTSSEALESVVTGSRIARDAGSTVQVEPPDLTRPYLRALEAAPIARLAAVMREQERRHGDNPAFYFDVAEWLHARGSTEEARLVLSNALELPNADVRTLAIVADRMARYGDFDRAVWAHERVIFLQPDLPQPRRNLAHALIARAERAGASAAARRADYARAVELLSEVVLTPWDAAYDGIGLISLTEANRIIPRLRQLGGSTSLDPRLIALLDVDLRVTLDWSTEATNLDLNVEEPGGERATPGLQVTASGGRVSNNIYAGYGPEEYQIRRAAPGAHTVRVQTLSTDRLDPNGPITVRARLYRDWGRPTETLEEVNVELRPGEDRGEQLIGRIEVGRPETRRR